MDKLSPARRFLKLFHPEAIPWVAATLYNSLSLTRAFQYHYELVASDILSHCSGGRLLDIGTGPGWLLLKLHEKSPAMRLVGLDASPAMVATARQNMAQAGLADGIEIREGNASHMPFADQSFDVIVSTGSIHHWKNPTAGLSEVHRVLKPGRYAFIYDLVTDPPTSVLDQTRREFGRLKTMIFWLHSFEEPFYTRASFEALARPTLFKECQSRFVGLLFCLILTKGVRG
jgi:ubiquinone/menaquinone biosynthesis C-methylase UbiE